MAGGGATFLHMNADSIAANLDAAAADADDDTGGSESDDYGGV